jgi:hypothetical protein
LRVRAFDAEGQVSRASDAEYRVDPNLVPFDDAAWRVWDISGPKVSGGPSAWSVVGGVVRETSNIYLGSATETDPEVERPGTLRIAKGYPDFRDGEIEFDIRSGDDDSMGFAFRVEDESHHYLWATDLQRKFRILARKDGADYQVLAKNDSSYQKNVWQRIKVVLAGDQITIFVDGKEDFSVRDARFSSGTVALYSWGSDSVEFRDLSIRPAAAN